MSASATVNRAAACWAGVGGGGARGGRLRGAGRRPAAAAADPGSGGVAAPARDAGAATDVRMFQGSGSLP